MKKYILIIILSFFAVSSFSQQKATKTEFYPINTNVEALQIDSEVILRKDLSIVAFDSLPIRKENHMMNYKVDENGKITFIKGNKGFAKTEISEELVGVHFPDSENDELIDKLNALVSKIKVIHNITKKDVLTNTSSREKQPDCKKLKNVIFYGNIIMTTVLKKS